MQKTATKIFICSSIGFGIVGLLMIFTTGINEEANPVLFKLMFTMVVITLTSFALSIAGKYLNK